MRRKTLLTTLALALTLVAGSVCAPLTARAAEPDAAVTAASETESNDDTSGQDEGGSGDSGSSDEGSSDSGSSDSGSGDSGSGDSGSSDSGSGDSGSSDNSGSDDDRGEIGDILDDIFGGNKPDYNPDKDPNEDDRLINCPYCGERTTPNSAHIWMCKPDDERQEELDNIYNRPSKPETPTTPGNSGNAGNTGSNTGSGTITGGVTDDGKVTVGGQEVPGIEVNDKGEVTVGGVVAGTKDQLDTILNNLAGTQSAPQIQTLPTRLVTAIPVADPATLALFPNSMFVQSPAGLFFHAVDAATGQYNLWNAGTIAAAFSITDAKGNVVTMTAPTIAYAADGSAYINVTIPAATKGAVLAATPEQKAAWLTYGIAGVMANGVTLEQFAAVPAAALVPAAPAA